MLIHYKNMSCYRQQTNTLLISGQKSNPNGGHLDFVSNIKLLLLVK